MTQISVAIAAMVFLLAVGHGSAQVASVDQADATLVPLVRRVSPAVVNIVVIGTTQAATNPFE